MYISFSDNKTVHVAEYSKILYILQSKFNENFLILNYNKKPSTQQKKVFFPKTVYI